VITIFGTTYFTIGAGLVVLVLAAPFLFWLSRWLWRPNVEDKPRRVRLLAIGGTTLGLLALLAVGLFWDVYLIGQRAKELCQETGLTVVRQASAQGFAGSAAIEYWHKYGFTFVETEQHETKYRFEIVDGAAMRRPIASFKAQYALVLIDAPITSRTVSTDQRIRRRGAAIEELGTGEVIAELTKFTIRHGWADSTLISLLGFVASPHTCGRNRDNTISFAESELRVEDLVLATLTPRALTK
jgi:hypothetical protein